VRLLTVVSAALLALHRDERGQFGFFKDLWDRATGGVEKIANVGDAFRDLFTWFAQLAVNALTAIGGTLRDLFVWFGQQFINTVRDASGAVRDLAVWFGTIATNTLRDLGAAARDLLTWFGTSFVNIVGDVGGRFTDLVTWFGTTFSNLVRDGAGALRDLATWFGTQFVNVVRDTGQRLTDLVTWFGTLIANAVKDAADATAEGAKTATSEGIDKAGGVLSALLQLPEDFVAQAAELNRRILKGEVGTTDEFLAALQGIAPDSNIGDTFGYYILLALGVGGWASAAGVAAADENVQSVRMHNGRTLFTPTDLRNAQLRGLLSRDNAKEQLQKAGYSADNAEVIFGLWDLLPSPSDLVRMAVREVFSPDVVARFGQDQDFPADFATFMQQQGFTDEWARRFWSAHWELPSANQGFEMLHRGVIDFETLQLLLRALDVMPFWRERLTEIAYSHVTRVDTRRLFGAGVWSRDQVLRSYLDQGYRPDNAESLTAWTVASFGEDAGAARDLTRAAIEKAFRQGRISDLEAIARLVELDYDEDEAAFFIANQRADLEASAADDAARSVRDASQSVILRAYRERIIDRSRAEALLASLGHTAESQELLLSVQDFENAHELTTLRARITEQRFRRGLIDAGVALGELVTAGLELERAELLVQRWEVQFAERARELTEAQLRRAMEIGILDEATYVLRVSALGFADEDALTLLALAGRAPDDTVRQLSGANIIRLYVRGIISRDDALGRLVAIGYIESDAELLLIAADQDIAKAAAAAAGG
jgi:hypothetical protein